MPNPGIDQVFGTGKKKKNGEKWLTEQKPAMPVYKLPVLLSWPLGAVLIPGFKGKMEEGGKGEITELEMGGSDDKEQLNRLRIFSLAKKWLKMKMIKIYIGV